MIKIIHFLSVLFLLSCSETHLVNDISPLNNEFFRAVIEISAGSNQKWEVDKESGRLVWVKKNNRPRIINYLPYPVNYGMIPRTLLDKNLGGDGDPIDVVVLGKSILPGKIVNIKIIGAFRFLDSGQIDDKLIAIPSRGIFDQINNLKQLKERYPGVLTIIKTWFLNYKGAGVMKFKSLIGKKESLQLIQASIKSFNKNTNELKAKSF